MNNKKLIKILSFLAVLLWAGVIFNFSAATGANSSALSGGISTKFLRFFISLFGGTYSENKVLVLDAYIRETSHSLEYAVFGMLIYNAVIQSKKVKKFILIISVSLGFLYAISDEIHQLFVPNRSFELLDLTMDLIGITIGALFCKWLYKLISRKNKHIKKML